MVFHHHTKQPLKARLFWVVNRKYRLGVSGAARAHSEIGGIVTASARVAGGRCPHSRFVKKQTFHTPKTAGRNDDGAHAFGVWSCHWCAEGGVGVDAGLAAGDALDEVSGFFHAFKGTLGCVAADTFSRPPVSSAELRKVKVA